MIVWVVVGHVAYECDGIVSIHTTEGAAEAERLRLEPLPDRLGSEPNRGAWDTYTVERHEIAGPDQRSTVAVVLGLLRDVDLHGGGVCDGCAERIAAAAGVPTEDVLAAWRAMEEPSEPPWNTLTTDRLPHSSPLPMRTTDIALPDEDDK